MAACHVVVRYEIADAEGAEFGFIETLTDRVGQEADRLFTGSADGSEVVCGELDLFRVREYVREMTLKRECFEAGRGT